MVLTIRSEFEGVVARSGIDGLLRELTARTGSSCRSRLIGAYRRRTIYSTRPRPLMGQSELGMCLRRGCIGMRQCLAQPRQLALSPGRTGARVHQLVRCVLSDGCTK